MPVTAEQLVQLLIARGPLSAADVKASLGIGPTVLSRLAKGSRGRVIRIGRARATRYAVLREIRTFGHTWSVYQVDASGEIHRTARLHALQPRAWWYDAAQPVPGWIYGDYANGLFPDLPWFLDDLRPQGFLGLAFARRYADELRLGPDPRHWDAGEVLSVVLRYGHDLPGDFVIGDEAVERVQRTMLSAPNSTDAAARPQSYPNLVAAVLSGEVAGSSAGGEQPKFTTCLQERDTYRHVMVKFSPPRDTTVGERWADLLVCEHIAASVLRDQGIDAVETNWLEYGNRSYLEVTRFDRVGPHGRRGVATLFALDSAYDGRLDNWRAASDRLERDGWLSREDAERLRLLWWFARLVANTDLHFGNISLLLDRTRPLSLAPAYDMLPMHYRPTPAGEVVTREFLPPLPAPEESSVWKRAAELASRFWELASQDVRISPAFRPEATHVLATLRRLRERFG